MPPWLLGTAAPVMKNGSYFNAKLWLVPSVYWATRREPTVVVAIACGSASVGAAIAWKLADLTVATGASPPPQAESATNSGEADAIGNSGAPVSSCRARRRENEDAFSGAWIGFMMKGKDSEDNEGRT